MSSFRPRKYCYDFCPESFYSFLGASCRLPGIYKKFQGKIPYNIFIAILVETTTPKRHFVINWPVENESFHMSSKITAIPIFCISTVLQRPDCLRRLAGCLDGWKFPLFSGWSLYNFRSVPVYWLHAKVKTLKCPSKTWPSIYKKRLFSKDSLMKLQIPVIWSCFAESSSHQQYIFLPGSWMNFAKSTLGHSHQSLKSLISKEFFLFFLRKFDMIIILSKFLIIRHNLL